METDKTIVSVKKIWQWTAMQNSYKLSSGWQVPFNGLSCNRSCGTLRQEEPMGVSISDQVSIPHTPPSRIIVCLLVGCLTSQQHASVFQGRICTDNFTCCHTEIEVADQTFHLTQSQYTDTGPTSPSADPITPGAWQGSHWSVNV